MADAKSLVMPSLPTEVAVYNHDVCGILTRLVRFITELYRSNSSNTPLTTADDMKRSMSYLDSVDRYLDWVVRQPVLDLPQTSHAALWPLWDIEKVTSFENDDVEDMVRLLILAHAELVKSNSARMANGIIKFDEDRLRRIIAKSRDFLTSYMAVSSPLDLPASAPMEDSTPPAR